MNKINFLLSGAFASLLLLASCGGGADQQATTDAEASAGVTAQMTADPEASTVAWSGTLVGVYTHTGTVALTDGSFNVENGMVTGGSFTADLTQMAITDDNYNVEEGSTPEKLIGHLSSADFFDVENFPTATFVVTGATEDGKVKGDLTVRGTTNEEVLEEVSIDAESGSATASLTFDRQKYGVAWAHPLQDMVLENDIKLTVNVKAKG
jgi:polyisoprenoid-binding protein YceI